MRRLLLVVLWLPFVAFAEQAPSIQRGFAADKVYDFSNVDTVNSFNGNLVLQIPIGPSYPVGGQVGYSLTLSYNSKVWDYEQYTTGVRAVPARRSNAGMGWLLSLGRLIPINDSSNDTEHVIYESPDGADHEFKSKLHPDDPAPTLPSGVQSVGYTIDGSYLRLTEIANGNSEVESPDGIKRIFDPNYGHLLSIHDRSGNLVRVTYKNNELGTPCPSGTTWVWEITDSANARTNYVCFEDSPDAYYPRRIERVILAAPPTVDGSSVYQFKYESNTDVARGCNSMLQQPGQPIDDNISASIADLPLLNRLILPDGSEYNFHYNQANGLGDATNCETGTLEGLTLPTGAAIDYTYRSYWIPVDAGEGCAQSSSWRSDVVGVWKREVSGPNVATGTWTYSSSLSASPGDSQCIFGEDQRIGLRASAPEEMVVSVKDPFNNTTRHYYSVWPWEIDDNGDPSLESPNGFRRTENGEPFTRFATDEQGGFLSRQVVDSSGTVLRSVYIVREQDDWPCLTFYDQCLKGQRRTKYERTVDEDGVWSQVAYSDFDGLGHYRTETRSGSAGAAVTTTTAYNKQDSQVNPGSGIHSGTYPESFALPPVGDPWILDTASKVTKTDGTRTLVTQQCYDPATGLLRARRTLTNASAIGSGDLLALFAHSGGNLTSESYFGGDKKANAPTSGTLCGIASSPPTDFEFKLTHGYTAGVRATSQYSGATFYSLNRTIHAGTGLATSERDTALNETLYEFDVLWRIEKLEPPGDAPTSYVYTNGTSDCSPPRVTATTGAAVQEYQYDGLGRLRREKRKMPNGTWSLRETQRDAGGRVVSRSELETIAGTECTFAPSHLTHYENFDGLGRAGKVRMPDDAVTTFTFNGIASTQSSRMIATSETEQTAAVTVEQFDHLGRLTGVLENTEQTSYGYDVTGNLATVTAAGQPARTFVYDGRGLLINETHPESGTTSYQYDSRGHVTRRQTPVATLTFDYDSLERVTSIAQDGIGPLKVYTYGTSGTNRGKLATAKRHNRVLGTDVPVTETYTYGGDGGRISQRATAVTGYGTFTEQYDYDDLGHIDSVTYPTCTGCTGLDAPSRTVTRTYTGDFLTGVPGYTDAMTYHGNGMLASLRHANVAGTNGPLYSQTPDSGMARPSEIEVTNYCEFALPSQLQDKSVDAGQPANLVVQVPSGATTFQWYKRVNGQDSAIAGQTTATLTEHVSVTTDYWVRVGNGTCTVDSNVARLTAISCQAPAATITAPASVEAGASVTASVSETSGATYAWTIPDGSGTITSATNLSAVTFKPSCSSTTVNLQVVVTASCGTATTQTTDVSVSRPSAVLSGSTTITQGGSATLSVALTGTGPWTLTWSDGATTSSGSRTVSPATTTTYTLTSVQNGYVCAGNVSGSATVTVRPHTPTSVVAEATGATTVKIMWASSGSVDSFTVERRSGSGGYVAVKTNAPMPYYDPVTANTAYQYRVVAIKGGTASTPSGPDLATTVMFEDTLTPNQTAIRAQHIVQLRTAIDAVHRTILGTGVTFTDADADLPSLRPKLLHVTQLKTALEEALSALGLPDITYDEPPQQNGPIRAEHLNKLRDGVK